MSQLLSNLILTTLITQDSAELEHCEDQIQSLIKEDPLSFLSLVCSESERSDVRGRSAFILVDFLGSSFLGKPDPVTSLQEDPYFQTLLRESDPLIASGVLYAIEDFLDKDPGEEVLDYSPLFELFFTHQNSRIVKRAKSMCERFTHSFITK